METDDLQGRLSLLHSRGEAETEFCWVMNIFTANLTKSLKIPRMKDEAIKCMTNNPGDSRSACLEQGKHNDWIPSYSMLLQQKYLYFHWALMLWNKRICSKQRSTLKTHILKVTGEHMLCRSSRPCQGIFIRCTAFSHACKHWQQKPYIKQTHSFSLGHSIRKSKMNAVCSFPMNTYCKSFFSRGILSRFIPPQWESNWWDLNVSLKKWGRKQAQCLWTKMLLQLQGIEGSVG